MGICGITKGKRATGCKWFYREKQKVDVLVDNQQVR